MEQFEIWRLGGRKGSGRNDVLCVVLQHSMLKDLETCMVAPLRPIGDLPPLGRLRPEVSLGRRRLRLIVDRSSVIRRQELTERLGSAVPQAEAIKRALDELYYGI